MTISLKNIAKIIAFYLFALSVSTIFDVYICHNQSHDGNIRLEKFSDQECDGDLCEKEDIVDHLLEHGLVLLKTSYKITEFRNVQVTNLTSDLLSDNQQKIISAIDYHDNHVNDSGSENRLLEFAQFKLHSPPFTTFN